MKKSEKKLALSRETLRNLQLNDLEAINGGVEKSTTMLASYCNTVA